MIRFLMPFPQTVAREITSIGRCEVCGAEESPEILLAHSMTGLHLVGVHSDEGGDITGFRVTSTTHGLVSLEGRVLGTGVNPLGKDAENDGMCVCYPCHEEIHASARATQAFTDPQPNGHYVTPATLGNVSEFFRGRGRPATLEVQEI